MAAKPESVEEKKFVKKIRRHGYICIKLQAQGGYGEDGFNDRLVFASYGVTALFEFKRVGIDEAEKLQKYRHKILKRMGHNVYVVQLCDEAYATLKKLVAKAKVEACAKKTAQALADKIKDVSIRLC
jgi:hypothetical protein